MSGSVLNAEWRHLERSYDVVVPDSLGNPMLAFRDGHWFGLGPGAAPRPVTARSAILRYPEAAGTVVQITCWWMREHGYAERALDLATEVALTVSELTRMAGLHDPLKFHV